MTNTVELIMNRQVELVPYTYQRHASMQALRTIIFSIKLLRTEGTQYGIWHHKVYNFLHIRPAACTSSKKMP